MGPTERDQVWDGEFQDAESFNDQQDQEFEAGNIHEVDAIQFSKTTRMLTPSEQNDLRLDLKNSIEEARLIKIDDVLDDPLKGISTKDLEELILTKFKEMFSENSGNISFGVNKKEFQFLWEAVSEYIRIVRNAFRRSE